jgi:hypothetical protein
MSEPQPAITRPEEVFNSRAWIEQHAPKRDDKPEIASPALRAEVHKIEVNEVKEKLTELNKRAEVFLLEEYARLRKPVGAVGF